MANTKRQILEIKAHLDPKRWIPEVTEIVVEETNKITDRIALRTPVDTGRTQRNWRTAFGRSHSTIFNPTRYTSFIFRKGDKTRTPIIGPIVEQEISRALPAMLKKIDKVFELD